MIIMPIFAYAENSSDDIIIIIYLILKYANKFQSNSNNISKITDYNLFLCLKNTQKHFAFSTSQYIWWSLPVIM